MALVNSFIKIHLYGELVMSREVHELQDGWQLHPNGRRLHLDSWRLHPNNRWWHHDELWLHPATP
jgi:hypothetical protein